MTVEMNPSSTRGHTKSGSQRRNSGDKCRSVPKSEDGGRQLSEDIHSLNSWSESINLSTSSSSESGSRHGSCSSHRGLSQQDVPKHKGKSRSSSKKKPSSGHEPTPTVYDYGPTSQVRSANFWPECEWERPLFPTSSLSTYEFINDPDFPSFNRFNNSFDLDQSDNPSRNLTSKSSVQSSCDNVRKEDVPTGKSTVMIPEVHQKQRLYPDLSSEILQAEKQTVSAPTQPSVSASANVNTKNEPATSPRSRPQFFTSFNSGPKLLHSQQSRSRLKTKALNGPFQSLPTTFSVQTNSEISPDQFAQYGANNTERNHYQGSTAVGTRLHMSQPSMASEPMLKRKPKSSSDLESLRQAFEHRLEPENVKTKVKSVWNNIKYGWTFKSKPSIKYDSPLYLLGRCYHKREKDPSSEPEEDFLKDFASRIWFTYRSNFYPIPGTKLSTDCGWGCMLRSGQMLIAQCLVTHYLGRGWRLYDVQTETQSTFYREIIRWFSDPVDSPSDKTPFCLHHLANFGRAYNKDPGEWYGPASVAYIFRDAFSRAYQAIPVLSQLCIYVAQDCTVYKDDVIKLCTARQKSESVRSASDADKSAHVAGATASSNDPSDDIWLRSVIILIPMRLGGEVMNEIYIPCVKGLLSHENCMGIIGGKPKHSLYFIGYQDDKLIYLDPHLCREAVDTSEKNFRIESYHCMTPRKLSVNKMDPSCTVGFYFRNRTELDKFEREIQEVVSPQKQKGSYPLFIFSGGSHEHPSTSYDPPPTVDRRVRVTHYHRNENGERQRTFSRESEDFIML